MECKLPNTHRKLLEAHRLWHQTLDNYFDAEGFRVNLNATIQALRNLTFVLQNEKKSLVNFDEWYAGWQELMKNDEVLKWLHSARVEIVHRKDLEKTSIARVSILAYTEVFKADIEIPIDLPEYMIAIYLRKKKIIRKDEIKDDLVLKVERRWIIESLDEYEILDALAYCFGFLYRLVKDCHEYNGDSIEDCIIIDRLHGLQKVCYKELGIPECMKISNKYRTKAISLKELTKKSVKTIEIDSNEEIAEKAKKRYKLSQKNKDIFGKSSSTEEFALKLFEASKIMLFKDGYHLPVTFLIDEKGNDKMYMIKVPEDRSDKYIMMQHIAELVRKEKATKLIYIADAWISSDIKLAMKGVPASEHTERKECLIMHLIQKDGYKVSYNMVYERNKFGKIKVIDEFKDTPNEYGFLTPIYEVWESKEQSKSETPASLS